MKVEVITMNVNMSKKDLINAKSASKSVKDAIGIDLIVSGCAIAEGAGTDKQGNPCDVGYVATDKGVFGFTSNVILKGMDDFAEFLTESLNEGEQVTIRFFTGKSKSGSEFYNFEVI